MQPTQASKSKTKTVSVWLGDISPTRSDSCHSGNASGLWRDLWLSYGTLGAWAASCSVGGYTLHCEGEDTAAEPRG